MFTGLVEERGQLLSLRQEGQGAKIKVACKKVLEDVKLGDSIATNGVCLTVTDFGSDYFTADLMAVTLKLAGFDQLKQGAPLNLERALRLKDRLGGHLLQGHVDAQGQVLSKKSQAGLFLLEVGVPRDKAKYMINQGSIGLNGVSLTIVEAKEASFVVSLIPETLGRTNLLEMEVGDACTVEFDVLAKYIERQQQFKDQEKSPGLSREFLMEHGF
ncbi:MAG: riboflavin synthase [Tissierellia bacterium]|nr:riboflavin synthase [Tissierellia bacterium]